MRRPKQALVGFVVKADVEVDDPKAAGYGIVGELARRVTRSNRRKPRSTRA